VRAKPDNQQLLVVVVDGDNQAIVIALDVEHHSPAGNDAGRAKLRPQFCRILPGRLFDFGIPSIQVLLFTPVLSRLSRFREVPRAISYTRGGYTSADQTVVLTFRLQDMPQWLKHDLNDDHR
jgi:hypothetical protein